MRRYWIECIVAGCMLAACQGNKTSSEPVEEAPADSAAAVDSTDTESEIAVIESEPVPKAADELFDDFIFNFAANKKLQFSRIKFPLTVKEDGKTETLDKSQWHMENFFMRQDFYTLIFDHESQLDEVKQMKIKHAVVEKIFLSKKVIRQYVFDRINGAWVMQKIVNLPICESHNASFLDFYEHFSASQEYQQQHVSESVHFIGPDPDDDFNQMEGVITPDTWVAFAPELPTEMIYNIIYGTAPKESNTKIFVLRGIANGLETELTFRHEGSKWMLVKLST